MRTTLGSLSRAAAGLPQGAQLQLLALVGGQPMGRDDLLDRDVAAQHLVAGEPHPAHATGTERLDQSVPLGDQDLDCVITANATQRAHVQTDCSDHSWSMRDRRTMINRMTSPIRTRPAPIRLRVDAECVQHLLLGRRRVRPR